jgi:sterol desaturase/sphingolipid hydroxylase (fatty acid hydroxylase superfamily)
MGLLSLEHSRLAYWADFVVYGLVVMLLSGVLLMAGPAARGGELLLCVICGLAGWTFLEYVLHRFVLHGVQPFRDWHAAHHARPTALIGTPSLLSASLILLLIFLPAWWLADLWRACAITLGMVAGFLGYSFTHHATHFWRAESGPGSRWLRQRKLWHAVHHHARRPGCYGVTTSFWDHVFGSARLTNTARTGP